MINLDQQHRFARRAVRTPGTRCKRARRMPSHRRRGSLYVSVVMVGAIVSIIALSALLVGRINRRSHDGLADATVARLNAQAALRLGMLAIENDPDWRFAHADGNWFTDIALSSGTYSLTVADPSDNDIADAAADPVVLTGIGRKGEAVHRTQITLAPLYRGYDCLQSAVHAGDDVLFNDTFSAYSNHVVSANDDVISSNSYVTAPVEAVDQISGWGYMQSTVTGVPPRTLPVADEVTDFYIDHGTVIDVNSIPSQFADVTRNSDFEFGDEHWNSLESTVSVDTATADSGANSLSVTGRSYSYSGVTQDVTQLIRSGRTYGITFSVYTTVPDQQFYLHFEIQDAWGSDDHIAGPFKPSSVNTWKQYTATIQPWIQDPVTSVRLVINSSAFSSVYGDYGSSGLSSETADFRIDAVSVRETGTVRAIDQVLLSPNNNPYGEETNPEGIYVIDMQSQRLVVRNCRVYGTLVILNPDSASEVGDGSALSMSPAVAHYPVLIIAGDACQINPGSVALVESAVQVNLNPPDAPYESVGSDTDLDDTFPTSFRGLIYGSHKLNLRNVSVEGAIISGHDIDIRGDFSMTYDSRFYRNPPPGFSGPEQIRLLLGSARRLAD